VIIKFVKHCIQYTYFIVLHISSPLKLVVPYLEPLRSPLLNDAYSCFLCHRIFVQVMTIQVGPTPFKLEVTFKKKYLKDR
jgi:hypothetical protein